MFSLIKPVIKGLLALGMILVFSFPALCQEVNPYTEEDLRQLGNLSPIGAGARSLDLAYQGVKGSPLLFDDWKTGWLYLKDRSGFGSAVSVALDLKEHLLYFSLNNDFVGSLPAEKLSALRLSIAPGDTISFKVLPRQEVEGGNDSHHKFYQVLSDGKFSLLKYTYKFFQKADYKGAYNDNRPYDAYLTKTSYWCKVGEGPYEKLKLKKKSVEKMLLPHAPDIRETMKSLELSFQDEEDLVTLFRSLEGNGH